MGSHVWFGQNDRVTSKKSFRISKKNGLTQSTIKTILGRLVGKHVLNTEKEGRKFILHYNIEEKEM